MLRGETTRTCAVKAGIRTGKLATFMMPLCFVSLHSSKFRHPDATASGRRHTQPRLAPPPSPHQASSPRLQRAYGRGPIRTPSAPLARLAPLPREGATSSKRAPRLPSSRAVRNPHCEVVPRAVVPTWVRLRQAGALLVDAQGEMAYCASEELCLVWKAGRWSGEATGRMGGSWAMVVDGGL